MRFRFHVSSAHLSQRWFNAAVWQLSTWASCLRKQLVPLVFSENSFMREPSTAELLGQIKKLSAFFSWRQGATAEWKRYGSLIVMNIEAEGGGIWIQGEGFGRETHAQSHLRKHKKLLSFKHYCVRLVLASRNTKCRANVKGTYSGENNWQIFMC